MLQESGQGFGYSLMGNLGMQRFAASMPYAPSNFLLREISLVLRPRFAEAGYAEAMQTQHTARFSPFAPSSHRFVTTGVWVKFLCDSPCTP
jgi:hypothetical protein